VTRSSGARTAHRLLHLPDLDDRHVLTAAIRARAQVIVTFNLSDFPTEVLADWDVEVKHPYDFLVDQFHLDAISVHKAIQAVADSWQKPPGTVNEVLDRLDRAGLPQTAAVLRR
jgi:hypothetical protein